MDDECFGECWREDPLQEAGESCLAAGGGARDADYEGLGGHCPCVCL